MSYPDWVLQHKKKGTYVNCVKGRYYLYAAHSERVPGTKKVKRICDGYLGRITEEAGFSRIKLNGRWYSSKLSDTVRVFVEKYHLTGRF